MKLLPGLCFGTYMEKAKSLFILYYFFLRNWCLRFGFYEWWFYILLAVTEQLPEELIVVLFSHIFLCHFDRKNISTFPKLMFMLAFYMIQIVSSHLNIIGLWQSPSTSHLEACQFVVNDHTAQLCLRIVQWLEGLASKALDLESKVISFLKLLLVLIMLTIAWSVIICLTFMILDWQMPTCFTWLCSKGFYP